MPSGFSQTPSLSFHSCPSPLQRVPIFLSSVPFRLLFLAHVFLSLCPSTPSSLPNVFPRCNTFFRLSVPLPIASSISLSPLPLDRVLYILVVLWPQQVTFPCTRLQLHSLSRSLLLSLLIPPLAIIFPHAPGSLSFWTTLSPCTYNYLGTD